VHVFLQGPKNIGKSTVILKTLDLLRMRKPVTIGGFFTWKGGAGDPNIYMRPAGPATLTPGTQTKKENTINSEYQFLKPADNMKNSPLGCDEEIFRLAVWDTEQEKPVCEIKIFEEICVHILAQSKGADLIVMDELGNLERDAQSFRKAVLGTLAGTVPVIGALRTGDIPWHTDIKRSPLVTLFDVHKGNRDALPQILAKRLAHI